MGVCQLIQYGYQKEDAAEIEKAYADNGIDTAVFRWAGLESDTYSDELRGEILRWLRITGTGLITDKEKANE